MCIYKPEKCLQEQHFRKKMVLLWVKNKMMRATPEKRVSGTCRVSFKLYDDQRRQFYIGAPPSPGQNVPFHLQGNILRYVHSKTEEEDSFF